VIQLEAAVQMRSINADLADACIHKAKELSRRGLEDMRQLVSALHIDSWQYSDLAENLRKLVHESSCDLGPKILFDCAEPVCLVPANIGYQLLQMARETVGNSLRNQALSVERMQQS
jgi:signal transduction histidine kinase